MPLLLQSKLLRALQEQEIEPLGSNRVEHVDVRIIAATGRDLAQMVTRGEFRADLYYRLNVLPIRLPALRERLADLEALVEVLSEDIGRRAGMASRSVSPEALALLARRDWPGNVRELRNTLEQAALMSDELVLEASHFDSDQTAGATRGVAAPGTPQRAVPPPPIERPETRLLRDRVADLERVAIAAALRDCGGNRVAAARSLGMSRAAFYDRLARWPELGV